MAFVTQTPEEKFEAGRRLRECREWRGLTREALVERIEALPDNRGKNRSSKQLEYLENGVRQMSNEYAILLSQALHIRIEYLQLKDNYRTEIERIGGHVSVRNEKQDLIMQIMKLHGYVINGWVTVSEQTDEAKIEFVSPSGTTRYLSHEELLKIIEDIDDYVDLKCASQFKRLMDGAKNIYKWEV